MRVLISQSLSAKGSSGRYVSFRRFHGCQQGGAHGRKSTYVLQLLLQHVHHVLLDNQMLLVEVFNDDVVVGAVKMDNDGLDGRLTLDEHACLK
jgi:hypothetical protein